jgi:hypothetical protein
VLRQALVKWARTSMLEAFGKGSAEELGVNRHRLVVETPAAPAWTDVLVARLASPELGDDASVLQASLSRAEAVLSELASAAVASGSTAEVLTSVIADAKRVGTLLYTTLEESRGVLAGLPLAPAATPAAAPAPSVPVAEPAAAPAATPAAPSPPVAASSDLAPDFPDLAPPPDEHFGPPPEDVDVPPYEDGPGAAPSRPRSSGRAGAKSSTPRTSPSARTARTKTSPDVPRKPKGSMAPAPGDTSANQDSRAALLLMSALPAGREDLRTFVRSCVVEISDAGVCLKVPTSLHGQANVHATELREAAARLSLRLDFAPA